MPRLPLALTVAALVTGLFAMALLSATLAPSGTRLALVLGEAALLAPLALAALGVGVSARDVFAWRGVSARTFTLALLCGAALWIASAGVIETQAFVWPPPPAVLETFRRLHSDLRPSGPVATLASLFAVAVAPACAEEMAFRGALLGSLRGHIGGTGSVLVSALAFGAIHVFPGGYRVPFALLLGLALGALRLRTGSVAPSIAAHAVLNSITLLATPWIDTPAPAASPTPLAPALGALWVGSVIAIAIIRALPKEPAAESPRLVMP